MSTLLQVCRIFDGKRAANPHALFGVLAPHAGPRKATAALLDIAHAVTCCGRVQKGYPLGATWRVVLPLGI
eukprot:scaffold45267_cov61-Phaeocystis_antarctica.AAC.1